MTDKNAAKKNKIAAFLKISLLIVIVIGIPLYVYLFHRDVLKDLDSFDEIVGFLRRYRSISVPIYFGAEILQILISVLPGQVFQFAAGYLFGFIPGLIYTIIGAAMGETITFYLARFLGTDAVHLMMGEERTKYYIKMLNSKRAYLITFFIYLFPGFPKDLICYIGGISEMKFRSFLIISMAGRTPAMAASIIFGSMYMKGNYTGMIIVGVVVAAIFLICLFKRKETLALIDRLLLSGEESSKPDNDAGGSTDRA